MKLWLFTNVWQPCLKRNESPHRDAKKYFLPADGKTFRSLRPYSVYYNTVSKEFTWKNNRLANPPQELIEVFDSTNINDNDKAFDRNLLAALPVEKMQRFLRRKTKNEKNIYRMRLQKIVESAPRKKIYCKCVFHDDKKPSAVLCLSKKNQNVQFNCFSSLCNKALFRETDDWKKVYSLFFS